MGRYIRDMELQLPEEEVEAVVQDFLKRGGFYQGDWKGELCYTSDYGSMGLGNSYGNPNLSRFYFFDYTYQGGILHFEAWVRDGKTKEVSLTGVYSLAMKQPYTAMVSDMENRLTAMLPEGSALRTCAESGSKAIGDNSRRMSKATALIYALALIVMASALMNVLRHLGLL